MSVNSTDLAPRPLDYGSDDMEDEVGGKVGRTLEYSRDRIHRGTKQKRRADALMEVHLQK